MDLNLIIRKIDTTIIKIPTIPWLRFRSLTTGSTRNGRSNGASIFSSPKELRRGEALQKSPGTLPERARHHGCPPLCIVDPRTRKPQASALYGRARRALARGALHLRCFIYWHRIKQYISGCTVKSVRLWPVQGQANPTLSRNGDSPKLLRSRGSVRARAYVPLPMGPTRPR